MTFDLDRQPIYEIGAALVTILTFSEAGDTDDDRGDVHAALCKWALHSRAISDSEWAGKPLLIKPIYMLLTDDQVDRQLRTLNRRFRDRMIAARMVMPFLKQTHSGELPKLDPPLKRLTINKMAERVLPISGQTEPGNVKSRVWRPSLPVLHLAAATEVVRQLLERHANIVLGYEHLLWETGVIAWILREAQIFEGLMEKATSARELRVDPAKLIRLRLVAPKKKTSSKKR